MEEEIYRQLIADTEKNLDLRSNKADFAVENFLENFRTNLKLHISVMLRNDYGKLLNMLYRVDVKESIVETCLKEPDIDSASERLADAVIERLMQKIKYRMQFSKGGGK